MILILATIFAIAPNTSIAGAMPTIARTRIGAIASTIITAITTICTTHMLFLKAEQFQIPYFSLIVPTYNIADNYIACG